MQNPADFNPDSRVPADRGADRRRAGRDAPRPPARIPAQRRRRRAASICLLVAATGLIVADLTSDRSEAQQQPPVAAAATARVAATATRVATAPTGDPTATGDPVRPGDPADDPVRPGGPPSTGDAAMKGDPVGPGRSGTPGYPETGPGDFRYADGAGPTLGTAGVLRRFRIAVEAGIGQDPATFATAVDAILGHAGSWTASRRLRLQRVPRSAGAEFTIYLATPGTSERMCATGGLRTEKYTSCRLPGQVIVNVARWLGAVPDYGAPLRVYQAYAVNHEVGHQLGHGHESCPAAGSPAPVMQQQTYGLRGCAANAWPYLDGRRYTGPTIL